MDWLGYFSKSLSAALSVAIALESASDRLFANRSFAARAGDVKKQKAVVS